MKQTKLSEGSNLLWESSRMILPEHKRVLQSHEKERNIRVRPQWDQQQVELFSEQITDAITMNETVKLELFDPYQQKILAGKITKVNEQDQKFQLTHQTGKTWLSVQDLIKIIKK